MFNPSPKWDALLTRSDAIKIHEPLAGLGTKLDAMFKTMGDPWIAIYDSQDNLANLTDVGREGERSLGLSETHLEKGALHHVSDPSERG